MRDVTNAICSLLLLALILVPMALAAFAVSPYMGVPFLAVLVAGYVKHLKYNT